jgi:hypothetical protein
MKVLLQARSNCSLLRSRHDACFAIEKQYGMGSQIAMMLSELKEVLKAVYEVK